MKDIKNISSIYFLGAGGIGMSAIARYFNSKGIKVSGYDKTETPLTKKLIAEGIDIHYTDDVALIDKNAEAVVYTPAIPAGHTELNFFKENGYVLLKRSDVLGMLTENTFNICVAGTHGKTTTCAMAAHILKDSGFGCNAFLGGIAANYDTNFWGSDSSVSVAEADEYDRSFLKLKPDVAVITAMDADHLEIYGDEKNMQDAFIEFSGKIKTGGTLLVKNNVARIAEFKASNVYTYSATDKSADIYVTDLRTTDGSYFFKVMMNGSEAGEYILNMGGMHNVENAVAAIAASHIAGVDEAKIKAAVASFAGVKRRFEYVIKNERTVMIDDYAHHPEELRALISGAKNLFPGKKCTIVFQPHLFTRTADHAQGFAEVLSMADEAILLPIYPARELPIPGVTSEIILDKMSIQNKSIIEKESLAEYFKTHRPEFLIMAGAGDIDTLIEPVKNILINQ